MSATSTELPHRSRTSVTAASLAATIELPRRLPTRYDGQPLAHLSHSSYTRFALCPEDWRRHYILGQRSAPTGSMFLGRIVDETLSRYHQRMLDTGERLTLDELRDAYRDIWHAAVETETQKLGIDWEAELNGQRAFELGLEAIEVALARLVPAVGEPVAVQRRLQFTLAPGLEWSVVCYLDLETQAVVDGDPTPTIVDYKVKRTPLTQWRADHDFQPAVYLAGRWLQGDPARYFRFAQIAKPGQRRTQMAASIITTGRTVAQLRGALVRIGQAAWQITAYHERFGPDQPGGFADPTGWKCSARYCDAFASCPGGIGIPAVRRSA